MNESTSSMRSYLPAICAVFLLGLALELWLCAKSWVGGDQLYLLRLGWDYATTGRLQPFAKMMTGAGAIPGSLLQLLIGVPLRIWPWFQAPLVVITLFDIAAGLLLIGVLRRAFSPRLAFIFFTLYWLSPWRVYHSGFLWEPQYVFLPAALHLWACWKLRERRAWFPSAVLVATLLLTMQLHGSFFLLVVLTAILLLRKSIRIDLRGALLGAAIGLAPLIPAIITLLNGDLPPARQSEGFFGRSLLLVLPMLKGALYWFRLGSLDIGTPLKQTIFFENGAWAGEHAGGRAIVIAARALQALGAISIAAGVWGSWWYFRPLLRKKYAAEDEATTDATWRWFRTYSFYGFIALVAAAGLSPITLQGWQVIIALHAATIPVAMWADHLRTQRPKWLRVGLWTWVALQVMIVAALAIGNWTFRRASLPPEVYAPESHGLQRIFPAVSDTLR